MEHLLIVSDLDDTLLNHKGEMAEDDRRRLNELLDVKNVYFSIATARDVEDYNKLHLNLNVNVPIILCNGRLIYDSFRKKIVHCFYWEQVLEEAVIQKLAGLDLVVNGVGVKENQIIREIIEPNFLKENNRIHGCMIGISTLVKVDKVDMICQKLREDFEQELASRVYENPYQPEYKIIDIQPQRLNKGLALEYLKGIIPYPCRTISFGNGVDDISMFIHSDSSVAVGDCPKEVLGAAYKSIVYKTGSVIDEIARYIHTFQQEA
jgi:hydroxymethylpyrimidine pyrophosphatase-like HAD family hydrolase